MQNIAITMLFFTLTLTACGSSKGPSNKAAPAASTSAGSNNGAGTGSGGVVIPQLTQAQIDAIGKVIGQLVADLFNSLSGVSVGDLTAGPQAANHTLTCPLGGTAALAGAGTVTLGGTVGTPTLTLAAGSGSVTFTNCQISVLGVPLKLNGTATLAGVSGTGTFVVNTAQQKIGFNLTGGGNTVGNIVAEAAGIPVTCAIASASNVNSNGNFSLATFVSTGTITVNTTGTICGLPVSAPVSFNF